MKNYSYILALAAITFALSSCSTTSFSSINRSRDILTVQSDFGLRNQASIAVVPIAAIEEAVPTEIALNNKIETKMELSNVPVLNACEQPSRKSVKAEMRQFTRDEKKEIRKAVLYAYMGKELPEPKSSKKGGPPFISQTGAAVIAFFLPPLGAGLYFGDDKRTWISLILFFLLWLPGAIYAIIKIMKG